jgi:hypothetical protein
MGKMGLSATLDECTVCGLLQGESLFINELQQTGKLQP